MVLKRPLIYPFDRISLILSTKSCEQCFAQHTFLHSKQKNDFIPLLAHYTFPFERTLGVNCEMQLLIEVPASPLLRLQPGRKTERKRPSSERGRAGYFVQNQI